MTYSYYFCTINDYLAKVQCQLNQPTFSLPEFLFFLRCLPLDYSIDKDSYKHDGKKYYLILDNKGPIFRIYLSLSSIEVIILHQPQVPTYLHVAYLSYSQVSHLYKKISLVNFAVSIYRFNLKQHFYILGNNAETTGHKLSAASFELLKILNKMFPQSKEVLTEKILCIESYSRQQQINIYRSIACQIQLVHILLGQKGVSRVYLHEQ